MKSLRSIRGLFSRRQVTYLVPLYFWGSWLGESGGFSTSGLLLVGLHRLRFPGLPGGMLCNFGFAACKGWKPTEQRQKKICARTHAHTHTHTHTHTRAMPECDAASPKRQTLNPEPKRNSIEAETAVVVAVAVEAFEIAAAEAVAALAAGRMGRGGGEEDGTTLIAILTRIHDTNRNHYTSIAKPPQNPWQRTPLAVHMGN